MYIIHNYSFTNCEWYEPNIKYDILEKHIIVYQYNVKFLYCMTYYDRNADET